MRPLTDYRFVRGVNHGVTGDMDRLERDLAFCRKLKLNAVRVWLSMDSPAPDMPSWSSDRDGYLRMLRNFVRVCFSHGVYTVPILWNGNGMAGAEHSPEEWERIDEYISDVTGALKDEEGLLMWDVMNEPCCCDWVGEAPDPDVKKERMDAIWKFVERLCAAVRKYDPVNAVTVGNVVPEYNEYTHDWVDVLSFHTYYGSRKLTEQAYETASMLGLKYNKPVLQTETGCICRGDSYEMELEMCEKYGVGWFLFNLVIEGPWSDVHGLVYPDGTVRDPAAIAALFGFHRKRDEGRIPANPNREGQAYDAIRAVEEALMSRKAAQHRPAVSSSDEILDAAELCVNLLEAAEMVPMWDAPSARLAVYRALPEEKRNIQEIRRFAYEMAKTLKDACLILEIPDGPTWAPDK